MKKPFYLAMVACLLVGQLMAVQLKAAELNIVASIKPVQMIVQALAAEGDQVTVLLKPGANPHRYSLRPSDVRALYNADLIVWVGPALEVYLANTLTGLPERQANANQVLQLLPGVAADHTHDDQDIHIWLSPGRVAQIAPQIAQALTQQNPEKAQDYQRHLDRFLEALAGLEQQQRQQLEPLKRAPYILYHDAYSHFETAYGLRSLAAISLDAERTPSAKHMLKLHRLVSENSPVCMVSEPGANHAWLDNISAGGDNPEVELDPMARAVVSGRGAYIAFLDDLGHRFADCLKKTQGERQQ